MVNYSPIAALPYPALADPPNAQTFGQNLTSALDLITLPRFSSQAAVDAAIPSPTVGQRVMRTNIAGGIAMGWNGSRWVAEAGALLAEWTAPNDTLTFVTFSSIPANWRHLQVFYHGRAVSSGNVFQPVRLQFNGDTGNNYSYAGQFLRVKETGGTFTYNVAEDGSGGVTSGSPTWGDIDNARHTAAGSMILGYIPGSSAAADAWGGGRFSVLEHTRTSSYKSAHGDSGWSYSAATSYQTMTRFGGAWSSTAAVSSMTILLPGGGTFKANSRVSVYGVA